MTTGERSSAFALWLGVSLAVHAVVLLAAPIGLPTASAEARPLRLSLAPPRLTSEGVDEPRPAPTPREPAPRRPRVVRPTAPQPETQEEHVATAPTEQKPRPVAEPPTEADPMPTDVLAQVFASDSADVAMVEIFDGIYFSGAADGPAGEQEGEAASGAAEGGAAVVAIHPPIRGALSRPPYPEVSRQQGEEGEVLLRVLVGTGGRVERVAVVASSGHKRLDDAARNSARAWRFSPARRGEDPISAWLEMPVRFRIEEPS